MTPRFRRLDHDVVQREILSARGHSLDLRTRQQEGGHSVGVVGDHVGGYVVGIPGIRWDKVPADERRAIAEMMAEGSYPIIILATANLDGMFERLQARGAEVVQVPTEQPYGVRDCAARDPAGLLDLEWLR